MYPAEPLIEVTAPLPEAQLVETIVLNQITYQTAVATKAVRCRLAARGRAALFDFSLRRTHGIEAGMAVARATAIAGFAGTSNAEAARRFGLAAVGTMAHSYVQAFSSEIEAFTAFAEDFPDRTTFVVDSYDTLNGVATAVETTRRTGNTGRLGVRLDSGDLLGLSKQTRRLLDAAGRHDAIIVASGGLDEFEVQRLLDAGAPIDAFGVGTKIGVSADAPSLDTAYKLVEYAGRPVIKLSPGKQSRPGPKQVYRSDHADDLLATRSEAAPPGYTPLLTHVIRNGQRIAPVEPIHLATERLSNDLARLPPGALQLVTPAVLPVRVSAQLETLTHDLRETHRRQTAS